MRKDRKTIRLVCIALFLIFAIMSAFELSCVLAAQGKIQANSSEKKEEKELFWQLKGLSRFKPTPKTIAIAKLLLEFNAGPKDSSQCLKFYLDMCSLGAGMQDVIGTKTLISNAAIDLGSGFKEDFLGKSFPEGGSSVEKALLVYRRKATVDAIHQVLREFAGKGGKNSVYLAEIGKWATQADSALTFSGDIDFSFVSLDENLTWQMKKRFDEIILEKTDLDPVKFDSVCTAHGHATPDVYIGEHGWMYGNEAMKGGQLKPINMSNGSLGPAEDGAPIIDHMVKELACQKAKSSETQPSSQSKEPGLSMEMVRHFNHDIVAPKIFDPIDSILKASKYVDRSCAAMASIPGAQVADPKLAEFCKEITKCAKNSDFSKMATLLDGYFGKSLSSKIVGAGERPQAKLEANQARIDQFFKTCTDAMWKNAETGFRSRLTDIDKQLMDLEKAGTDTSAESPAVRQMRANMLALLEMCKLEFAVCDANHLEVPAPIHSLYEELKARIDKFTKRKGVKPLSDDEMKQLRFIQDCIKSGKKPLETIAMAYTVDVASKTLDKANNILDYLDDSLLGPLRGDSPDFDKFVIETRAARLELENPAKRDGALAKLGSLKSSAAGIIRAGNSKMNAMIQSTSAGRGTMKTMQAVNLGQEVQAYYESYNRDGYEGLAVEFFRRRVPGGGAVDAYYQESYLRAGVELVYMIFPPAAIPEGLYGMASQALEWSGGKLTQWQYAALVDELYENASFEPGPNGFTLYKLRYDCPGDGVIELVRADAHKLPDKCPRVWQLIAPQIKYHTAIQVYEEMLAKKEVSSGRDSIFPYTYSGLNTFGARLQQAYRKQVDQVVVEYFKGVIAELEKRRNFEGGETWKKLKDVEKALGCSKPLVKDPKDRKLIEELINDYESVKKANAAIARLSKQYDADMIQPLKPICGIYSLQNNAARAKFYLKAFEEALTDARAKVEAKIGRDDPQFDEKAKPATRARIGMAWFSPKRPADLPGSSDPADPSEATRADQYSRWYNEFQNELAKLNPKDLSIKIDFSPTAYVGYPWEASVAYDRPNPKRVHRWEFLQSGNEKFKASSVNSASWLPTEEGKVRIRLSVKEDPVAENWITKTIEVEVLPASKAPKLIVKLSAGATTLAPDELMPVSVIPVESNDADPFVRYFWYEDGVQKKAGDEPVYEFSAAGKPSSVVLSAVARTKRGLLSQRAELKMSISGDSGKALRCWIKPLDRNEISDQDSVELSAEVARKFDSSEIRYQWTVDGKPVSNEVSFDFKGIEYLNRKVNISLYVQELINGQLKSEGRASKQISVVADKLIVVLTGCPESIALGSQLQVSVRSPKPEQGKYTFAWYEFDGRGYSSNSYSDKDSYTLYGREVDSILGLKVVVRDARGRTGEAETSKVRVVEAAKGLNVSISPSTTTIVRGNSIRLKVAIQKLEESGLLTLNGVELPAGVSESSLNVTSEKNSTASILSVSADVSDEMGRKGSATATIYLKDAPTKPDTTTAKKPDGTKKPDLVPSGPTSGGQKTGDAGKTTDVPSKSADGAKTGEPTKSDAGDKIGDAGKTGDAGKADKKADATKVSDASKPADATKPTGTTTEAAVPETGKAKIVATIMSLPSGVYYGQTTDIFVQIPPDVSQNQLTNSSVILPPQEVGTKSGGLSKPRPKDFATRFPGITVGSMEYVEALVSGDPKAGSIVHICPPDEEYCPTCAYRKWLTEKPAAVIEPAKGKKLKKVIWHSDPAVLFKDGTTSGARNSVTFDRMKAVKIWAQLEIGDDDKTVYVDTEPVETIVKAPEFKINFAPLRGGKPGQEITATVSESPTVADKLVNFKWDMPASNNRLEISQNARSIKFKLKDKDSYKLLVQPLVPFHSDYIGGAIKADYEGGDYTVKAQAEERGPKPMMWDPVKQGLVEVPKGSFAAFEQVYLKATLEGEPQPAEIRWNWQANEGTSISNPISSTPTMSRSEPGTASATVTAKDKDGVVLGTQNVSVNFTISKEQLLAPLRVTLSADKARAQSGQTVSINAGVLGGKPPYTYFWKGRASTSQKLQFTAGKPGTEDFAIEVSDANGKKASAQVSIAVEAAQLVIELQADKNSLNLQEKAMLSAKLSGGQAPYNYTWKGVSSASEAKAEFIADKPEAHEIILDVSDSFGNKGSKSISLNVLSPGASVSASPASIQVGQTSALKVALKPAISLDALAVDWRSSAGRISESGSGTAVLSAGSEGDVKVTARITDRKSGAFLCESSVTISVKRKDTEPTKGAATPAGSIGKADKGSPGTDKPAGTEGKPGPSDTGWKIPGLKPSAGTASGGATGDTQTTSGWKTPTTPTTSTQTSSGWKMPTTPTTSTQTSSGWKMPSTPTTSTQTSSGWKTPTTPTTSTQTSSGWKMPTTPTTSTQTSSGWKTPTTPTTSTQTSSGWKMPTTPTTSTQTSSGWKTPTTPTTSTQISSGWNAPATSTTAAPSAESLAYVASFAGTWDSNWGVLTFTVHGTRIRGNYTHDNGRIEASLSSDGHVLTGHWLEAPSYTLGRDGGRVSMSLSADGKIISGNWGYGNDAMTGGWTGTKRKTSGSTKPVTPKLSAVPSGLQVSNPTGRPPTSSSQSPVPSPSAASSSSSYSPPLQAVPVRITAMFENRDNMPIHMWAYGDSISPFNKVAPGGVRRHSGLRVQDMENKPASFWVGRNGQVLQMRRWTGVPAVPNGGVLKVIWDGRQLQFSR
jgi:hypothetical protein